LIIGALILLDLTFANIPSQVPTDQAVSAVENSARFKAIVGDSTYNYVGYTNHSPSQQCIPGPDFRYIDPLHEYTTTTLVFAVAPNVTSTISPYDVLAQANPNSGRISSIAVQFLC
jgi:hypothetical protein